MRAVIAAFYSQYPTRVAPFRVPLRKQGPGPRVWRWSPLVNIGNCWQLAVNLPVRVKRSLTTTKVTKTSGTSCIVHGQNSQYVATHVERSPVQHCRHGARPNACFVDCGGLAALNSLSCSEAAGLSHPGGTSNLVAGTAPLAHASQTATGALFMIAERHWVSIVG